MQDLKTRLRTRWSDFIRLLRSKADPDDADQVFVDDFISCLLYFKIKLNQGQLETLTNAFPGRKDGNRERIKVGRFYDIHVTIEHHKTYKDLKVRPTLDNVADASGYTGQMNRKKMADDAVPLSEAELMACFLKENKMTEFLRLCREINPDKNGVITVVELDDILRILYEDDLEGRDLTELYEPFCSIQNKILVDYRGFRDNLNRKIKEIEVNFHVPLSALSSQKQTIDLKAPNGAENGEDWADLDQTTAKKERSRQSSLHKGAEHGSSQGIMPLKEIFGNESAKRDLSRLRNLKSATELAHFKKRASSNAAEPVQNKHTQNDDLSPYAEADYQYNDQNGHDSFSPMHEGMEQR